MTAVLAGAELATAYSVEGFVVRVEHVYGTLDALVLARLSWAGRVETLGGGALVHRGAPEQAQREVGQAGLEGRRVGRLWRGVHDVLQKDPHAVRVRRRGMWTATCSPAFGRRVEGVAGLAQASGCCAPEPDDAVGHRGGAPTSNAHHPVRSPVTASNRLERATSSGAAAVEVRPSSPRTCLGRARVRSASSECSNTPERGGPHENTAWELPGVVVNDVTARGADVVAQPTATPCLGEYLTPILD